LRFQKKLFFKLQSASWPIVSPMGFTRKQRSGVPLAWRPSLAKQHEENYL
jgi:hypothetical protein